MNFYKAEAVDYQKVLDDVMAIADILTSVHGGGRIRPAGSGASARRLRDVPKARRVRCWISTTVPTRTLRPLTPPQVAWRLAPAWARVMWITYWASLKAYSTRVGAGPFPTELFDETGEFLCKQG
ncbi:adenylosuccinate synthetase [Klebsiella pneumoniae subsp. pneumoniae]|nr:adenylosuccinate synthetase [Klebsiella pneumoniae subsp. pneumoniae]